MGAGLWVIVILVLLIILACIGKSNFLMLGVAMGLSSNHFFFSSSDASLIND